MRKFATLIITNDVVKHILLIQLPQAHPLTGWAYAELTLKKKLNYVVYIAYRDLNAGVLGGVERRRTMHLFKD